MKVVIPMDENKETVCVAFARAPYFMVYDTDTDTKSFHDNPAASAQGGAGIKAAQFAVDLGAKALITVRLGENSAEVLKEAGVEIYKSSAVGVKANIDDFNNKALAVMTQFHKGFHGKA